MTKREREEEEAEGKEEEEEEVSERERDRKTDREALARIAWQLLMRSNMHLRTFFVNNSALHASTIPKPREIGLWALRLFYGIWSAKMRAAG